MPIRQARIRGLRARRPATCVVLGAPAGTKRASAATDSTFTVGTMIATAMAASVSPAAFHSAAAVARPM